MLRKKLLWIALLAIPFFLNAEEAAQQPKEPAPLPAVNNLGAEWWSDNFSPTNPDLSKRLDAFYLQLTEDVKALPEQDQKTAQGLLRKIELNFAAYKKGAAQQLPLTPVAGTIASTYTVEDLVNLHRTIRRQKVEAKSIKGEKEQLDQQIAKTTEALNHLRTSYNNAESRSEKRLVQGLEIVALRSNVQLASLNLEFVQKRLSDKLLELSFAQEELAAAVKKVAVSDLDLFLYAQQVKVKEEEWEKAKEQLKEISGQKSGSLSSDDDIPSQKLAQQTTQAAIKEALARNELLFAQGQLALAQLYSIPGEIDYSSLREKAKQWDGDLHLLQQQAADWRKQEQQQLERSSQPLPEDGKEQKPAIAGYEAVIQLIQENLLLLQQLDNQDDDVQFLMGQLDKKLIQQIGGGKEWLQTLYDGTVAVLNQADYWLSKELFVIAKTSVTFLGILRFFFILFATFWLSRLAMHALLRFGKSRQGVKKAVLYRVSRLCYYLLLVAGLIIALSSLGFDFSNLLLVAGALGVGLGFGLQSIFNNFISGIIILFETNLKVGDFIELESGLRGEIREINVRSTVITDNDGIDVLIPNSEIINNKVLNWTLKVPYRRIQVPFSVAYGCDKDFVAKVVIDAAMQVPHTLTKIGVPEPAVRLAKLGDNGLEFELVVWVKDKYTKRSRTTRSDYLWAIETAFREHNISIPYPQMELRLPPPGKKDT